MSVRMKPMQILCKFIGVAPYSFDPGSSRSKFKTSKFGIIYSSFIAALLTWFAVINYETISFNQTSATHVTIIAQWLQFYINNGFSVIIVIANSLQQWEVVKVLNKLFDTNNQPEKILDYEESYKDIFYGTAMVIVTIFLHLLTTLTSYFDNQKRIDYYWFPYGILFLLNTLVVLQFLCGVVKVGKKFQALNVRLEDCINEQKMVIAKYKNAEMINLEVNEVAKDHLELVDETNLLISAFSYQLLLSFVAALIILVCGLYMIIKRIIQYTVAALTPSISDISEKEYDWWCLTCYPLLHSILLGLIISVCHWTIDQTDSLNGIALRVQRVLQLSKNSSAISDFCHQLLLKQISFNVFHIFTISPSMICSIISTVLTYLIILIQFELSQDIDNTMFPDSFNSEGVDSNYSFGPSYDDNTYEKYK